MLIEKKFEYPKIQRVDSPNGRVYVVGENQQQLPSITTILSKTKDLTHIQAWKESVGEAKASKILAESSALGTGLHTNIERYMLGQELAGSYMSQVLARVIIKNAFPKINEVWGNEVSLYANGLYAGTTDLVGVFNSKPSIMDFKNSIREKKKEWIEDYFLQCCAYAMAHNEMFDTDISCGVIMMVTRDGKYQEFVIEGAEFDHYTKLWTERLFTYYDKFVI